MALIKTYLWLWDNKMPFEKCWVEKLTCSASAVQTNSNSEQLFENTYRCRCQQTPVSLLGQSEFWWTCPEAHKYKPTVFTTRLHKNSHETQSCVLHSSLQDELTKREELSLRMVLAFPNASMAGLASIIWSSKDPWIQRETLQRHIPSMVLSFFSLWTGTIKEKGNCWDILLLFSHFLLKQRRWRSTVSPSWCWLFSRHLTHRWKDGVKTEQIFS